MTDTLSTTTTTAACVLMLTCVAAVTDYRNGLIPNWLTLPPLLLAPTVRSFVDGPWALAQAVAAAIACGLVPLCIFRRGAMGGGDVKLFAAIGAIAGVHAGLELQLTGYAIACSSGLCTLLWRRQLGAALARTWMLALALFLPSHRDKLPPSEELIAIRLGVPVSIAAAVQLSAHALRAWP